jgi:hypothetical protein
MTRAKSGVTALSRPSDWPGLAVGAWPRWVGCPRGPDRAGLGRRAGDVSVSEGGEAEGRTTRETEGGFGLTGPSISGSVPGDQEGKEPSKKEQESKGS